jgi:hypothetical protein
VLIGSSLYLYFFDHFSIKLGMQNPTAVSKSVLKKLLAEFLPTQLINRLFRWCGPLRRCPGKITPTELIRGLVFHVLAGAGTLAQHMKQLTGKTITDGALSQRRTQLHWQVFESLMEAALSPKAKAGKHPEAFYEGLRLCGLDGSRFSVANTPQVKEHMSKANSRRMKAAFAKVGVAVLVELGIHNPIAAAIGAREESEMVLAEQLIDGLPEKSLLISDRYYGVPKLLIEFREIHPAGQREFLVRVRGNIKSRVLEVYADGSALVEIVCGKKKMLVREIRGQVQRGSSKASAVRLWTSLLDWRKHRAGTLLALYARRWEQETFYKELKVDMRSTPLVQSHTPLTAAQEIAALILAYAILVEERIKVAAVKQVEVLRISFLKTLEAVRGLWRFLEVTEDMLTVAQVKKVVQRTMRQIAEMAIPKRRQRSCPRAIRQPVSSWPRLLKNTYQDGAVECEISPISA